MPADTRSKLASLIAPRRVIAYANGGGWVRAENKREDIVVLQRPTAEARFDQLIVPLSLTYDDYAQRILDVVDRLARSESRSSDQVLNELLAPPSDVLRFRLDDPVTADGSVPFGEGFELLKGVQRSIRAAACSVIDPQKFHRRLTRDKTDLLLQGTRLGQTERGSFVAIVILPLDAVPADDLNSIQLPLFEVTAQPPFVRSTTLQLMHAVTRVATALADGHPELIEQPTDTGVQVSANLCDALLEMQPPSERSSLFISASWARTLPPSVNTPSTVELKHEYFAPIAEYARRLRPQQEPQRDRFVGRVVALMGKPNDDGQMAGDVTVQFQHEDELLRARITLEPQHYQIACDAHKQHSYVSVEGMLVRLSRLHQIEGYSRFQHLVGM